MAMAPFDPVAFFMRFRASQLSADVVYNIISSLFLLLRSRVCFISFFFRVVG